MTTWVVGDLQGCLEPLQRLLEQARFDPARDRLWLTGDLVNRGPASAACVRFVRSLGDRAVTVLGNHDLHLLAIAAGLAKPHRDDTTHDLLNAPDRDALLDWLRHRPLLHVEAGAVLVHAGLLPQWTVTQAATLAREVEAALQGPDPVRFLERMYGNHPARWDDGLRGADRLRVVVNAFTRLRLMTPDGGMDFAHKGELDDAPPGLVPWFDAPDRRWTSHTILFGHWSALNYRAGPGWVSLDSGCVWGRSLTATSWPQRQVLAVPCP
ncbi:MAG: symmetrical bis(5'-nucleosyl)-tetraphosphatase [Burkholderiales bacterium]|nr:symmetrical bis(5'-nucleosyl)-tetraphosphatase [Burkholderiales bacterium]